MDLAWLDDLAALATHLNFSRAAEARNVTQPAFSRRIKALEEWVGCSLVERETHKIRLTASGQIFLDAALESMRLLQQSRTEARAAADGDSTLRFASTHALSLTFFPKWFSWLSGVAPVRPISLMADNMASCERIMLEGGADFLLCHRHPSVSTALDAPDFDTIPLATDRLVLVSATSPDGGPVHAFVSKTVEPTPFLAFDERSGIGRIVAAVAPDLMRQLNLTTVFTSHLALGLKSLALEGRGVAWAPMTLVRDDIARCRLAVVRSDVSIPIEIVLVRGRGKANAATGSFWSYIRKNVFHYDGEA